MYLLCLLSIALGGFQDIIYGDFKGPLVLEQPLSWQVSPIKLNSNHKSSFTTLYILFHLKYIGLDIRKFYSEIQLSEDENPTECIIVPVLEELNDWAVQCDYSVDQAGTYGPITLTLRLVENGQIFAESKTSGYFTILEDEPVADEDSLMISYLPNNDIIQYVLRPTDLKLNFTLSQGQRIHPGDYLVLKKDPSFLVDNENFNLIVRDNEREFEGIDIEYDEESMELYIFGFMETIEGSDAGNTISIILNSMINPWYENNGDEYDWSLKVWRFGTPTVLYSFKSSGPAQGVTSNNVTVVSWAVKNDKLKNYMANGLVAFTEIVIQADDVIPKDGSIVISASKANFCGTLYTTDEKQVAESGAGSGGSDACSILAADDNGNKIDCVVADTGDNSELTCAIKTEIPPQTNIFIVALTDLKSASPSITAILTRDADDRTINSLKDAFTVSASAATLLTVNQLYIAASYNSIDGKNQLGDSGKYGVVFAFNAPVALSTSDSFKVYLPVSSANTRNKDTISLSTDYFGIYETGSNLVFTATSLNSASTVTNNKVTVSTGFITYTLEEVVAQSIGIVYYIGASSKADPQDIYLSLKPTILSDFSEASVLLVKDGVTYIYSQPFYINSNSETLDFTFYPFCTDVVADGLPVKLSIVPQFDYKIGSLEAVFAFDKNLTSETDLKTGGPYPSVDGELILNEDGYLVLELDSFTKNTEITFTIAYPAFAINTAEAVSLTVYLLLDSEKVEVFSKSASFTPEATEITYSDSTGSISLQTDSTYTFSLAADDHDASGSTTTPNARFAYLLPQGFSFSGSSLNLLGSGFQYYSYMVGYSSKAISETASVDFTQIIGGPWYEYSSTGDIILAIAIGESFAEEACLAAYKKTITVNSALGMTLDTFEPRSNKAFTIEQSYIELILTLKVTQNIMPSSYLKFEIGDDWADLYLEDLAYIVINDEAIPGEYISSGVWKSDTIIKKSTGNIEIHAWVKLPKITSNDGSVSYVGFKTVSITYSGGDSDALSFKWTQSSDDTQAKVFTQFSAGNSTPKVSGSNIWAFPDVEGSKSVYLGVEFDAPVDIPAHSFIKIDAGFEDDDLVADHTWLNFGHASADITDGVLTLKVIQNIPKGRSIEIVKDGAFDLESAGFKQVLIKVIYNEEYIIDDSNVETDDNKQGFTIKDPPTLTLTDDSVYSSKPNAGFDSYYYFSLEFSGNLEGAALILFEVNKDFNAQPGYTFTLEYFPGVYYIEAYIFDDQGNPEFLLCRAEHWIVTCMLPESVQELSKLDIALHLMNPSDKSYCSIYLMDWDDNLVAVPFYIDSSEAFTMIQTFSGSIDLLFALPGSMGNDRGLTHTMTLVARLDQDVSSSGAFVAVFPSPYNLGMTDPSTTKCLAIYDDGSGSNGAIISSESKCEIENNLVIFKVDENIEDGFKLSSDFPTRFMIAGVISPKDGYLRENFIYEKPAQESTYFTQSFALAYATLTNDDGIEISTIESISLGNLNAAFAHFEKSNYEELQINGGEKLIVAAGCFVGKFVIHPKGEGLFAKEMEISGIPRNQAPLILSQQGVYRLRPERPTVEFMVGAPSDAIPGFYYIDWKIREDPFGKESFYAPPPPTMVEVNSDITYPIKTPLDIIVPPGYKSFPYPIQIDGGQFTVNPYDTLQISFTHDYKDIDLKFYPDILFLDERRNYATVSLDCVNCTIDSVYEFRALLDGPSADTFRVDESFKFVFKKPYESPAITKLDVMNQTSNSFDLSLYSDSLAIVTWALAGELIYSEEIMTEQYIFDHTQGFGSLDDNKTSFDEKFDDYSEQLYDLLSNASSYDEFAIIAMNIGRSIYLVKQDFILENEVKNIASFSELVPDSSFMFYIYVNNFCGEESALTYIELKTQQMPPHAMIEIEDVADDDNLTETLVSLFKIDSNRVEKRQPPPPKRGLSTSESIFLYSSMTSSSSAYDQVSTYSTSELSSELGVTVTSITKISTDTYDDGEWQTEPLWLTEDYIVTLNFTSTTDGSLICEIETNPNTDNYTITTSQVLYGLDRTGAENNDTGYNLEISAGVEESYSFNFSLYYENVYVISCIVCNDYPLTPECSNVTSEEYSPVSKSSFAVLLLTSLGYILV